METTEPSLLKEIKKSFFTFRNGIVADTLRKAGMPYKMIFGLQIPQIAAISREMLASFGDDPEKRGAVAEALWADRDVRESRILAPYIYDPEQISVDKALELAANIRTREEADMLAFRLFKRMPDAQALLAAMEASDSPADSVAALRSHLE